MGSSVPTLGRSSSFRKGAESRNFGSRKTSANSSGDVPSLSQRLMLGPIVMDGPKYARSIDLGRVLGFSVAGGSEDNSFTGAHPNNSPPMAVKELKRLRASVEQSCVKANGRAKKLDEHLNKLEKYCEAMPSKKQQQLNEMSNERPSGSTLKIRPQAEIRSNTVLLQPLLVSKERALAKDNNEDYVMVEGQIRRLPAGGEGWEKKRKRKRSVGAVYSRPIDNDGEPKRTRNHKLINEPNLLSGDSAHGIRSGASGGSNKLDPMPSPAGSTDHMTLKNEKEKSMLSRDLLAGSMKEQTSETVNKLINRESDHAMCPSPLVKGKASRVPRSSSMAATNLAANVPRGSLTLESWEQHQAFNKTPSIAGTNNRKRALPSSSPIIHWVGQRPQRISRTRRTNPIPVPNHDEVQMPSEGYSPSDFGNQISIGEINSSLSKSVPPKNQNFEVKHENVPSPAKLSENDESGAGEYEIKAKGVSSRDVEERTGQSVEPSENPRKKNKINGKEEGAEKRFNMVTPLLKRLLSAFIVEDEIEEHEETGFRKHMNSVNDSFIGSESKHVDRLDLQIFGVQIQQSGSNVSFPGNGNTSINRSPSAQDRQCNSELLQMDGGYMQSELEVLVRRSGWNWFPQNLHTNNSGISLFGFHCKQMPSEEKLAIELQSIGIVLEDMPALDDKEDELVNHEISQLETGLNEQATTTVASEPALWDTVYAAPHRFDDKELLTCANMAVSNNESSFAAVGNSVHHSNKVGAKNRPTSCRGKKKEVLLDDVSGAGAVFRASSARGISGGPKGKRRERDSNKNTVAKAKSKQNHKPKQKTAQLSTSGNIFPNRPSANGSGEPANNSSGMRKDVSIDNGPPVSSKESKGLDNMKITNVLDGLDEEPQDMNSFFDFNVEDHDSVGLAIPMDDLADLF